MQVIHLKYYLAWETERGDNQGEKQSVFRPRPDLIFGVSQVAPITPVFAFFYRRAGMVHLPGKGLNSLD